jgi:hypothetical protein
VGNHQQLVVKKFFFNGLPVQVDPGAVHGSNKPKPEPVQGSTLPGKISGSKRTEPYLPQVAGNRPSQLQGKAKNQTPAARDEPRQVQKKRENYREPHHPLFPTNSHPLAKVPTVNNFTVKA